MFLNRQPAIQSCYRFILDAIFPIRCIGCGQPQEHLCHTCTKRIPIRLDHVCPICRKRPTPSGRTCFKCSLDTPPLNGIFTASYYRVPVLKRAIMLFKYHSIAAFSTPLSAFLAEAIGRSDIPLPDIIIPVPLHSRRLRQRGFNQSSLLAAELSASLAPTLEIPMLHLLIRTKNTAPQVRMPSIEDRYSNIRNAFSINENLGVDLHNKTVWLIDDVTTTGATLSACATVLKAAGVKSVFGITIASALTQKPSSAQ